MSEKIPISDDDEQPTKRRTDSIHHSRPDSYDIDYEADNVSDQARQFRDAYVSLTEHRIKLLYKIMDAVDKAQAQDNRNEKLKADVTKGIVLARMEKADDIAARERIVREIQTNRDILDR